MGGSFHPGSVPTGDNAGTQGGDRDRLTCTPGSFSRWAASSFSASSSTVWMQPGETLCGRQGRVTPANPTAQPPRFPTVMPGPSCLSQPKPVSSLQRKRLLSSRIWEIEMGRSSHNPVPIHQHSGRMDPRTKPREQTLRSHQPCFSTQEALGLAQGLWDRLQPSPEQAEVQGTEAGRTSRPPGQHGAHLQHCLGTSMETLPG